MRARQRHFNPNSAESTLTLDSRFIASQSDGDLLSNWSSRGTANATASGSERPTYKTNIINGNPTVRFNGSTNLMRPNETDTANCVFCVVDLNSDVNHALIGNFAGSQAERVAGWHGGNYKLILWGSESFNSTGQYTFGQRAFLNGSSAANTNANPQIVVWDRNTASAVTWTTGSTYRIGFASPSYNYLNGDIGCLVVLPTSPSNSLRKRIEKSLAFSFKIACN
jgi:hypothetical protein